MDYARPFCRRPAGELTPVPSGHDRPVVLAPILDPPPEVAAFSFRDTVTNLQENSYIQHFAGLYEFYPKPLFDPSKAPIRCSA